MDSGRRVREQVPQREATGRRRAWTAAAACACLAAAAGSACSSGPPLGGPHGGEAPVVGPDQGNSSSSSAAATASSSSTGTGSSAQMPDASTDGAPATTGPTFSTLFNAYLTGCKMCHTQTNSSNATYLWLRSQGYITGSSPALVSTSQSCLSWYGGNMPPGGGDDATAVTDMNAWAAAGALNN
jgi:hypothetical protein